MASISGRRIGTAWTWVEKQHKCCAFQFWEDSPITFARVRTLCVLAVFLQSCSSPPPVTSPSEIETPPADVYESLDDQFLSVAQEIPEFAGFYLNEDGNYIVNLASKPGLQAASVNDVEKAIENVFGTGYLNREITASSNGLQTPQIQIRAVRYTFEDLADISRESSRAGRRVRPLVP